MYPTECVKVCDAAWNAHRNKQSKNVTNGQRATTARQILSETIARKADKLPNQGRSGRVTQCQTTFRQSRLKTLNV
jgi:hypothetical protein